MGEFIADYKRDKMINTFKASHPDWQEKQPAMAALLNEQVSTQYGVFSRSQLVNEGILSLEDIYVMAKGASPVDTAQIEKDAQQKTLQDLANTQRAGGSQPHATNLS